MDLFEITARIDGADFGSGLNGDLEIEWRPREEAHDQFRIQFMPVTDMWSCGWHQNRTHEERSPCHIQIDHCDRDRPRRGAAHFDDGVPMAVLEVWLNALREHGNDPERIVGSAE